VNVISIFRKVLPRRVRDALLQPYVVRHQGKPSKAPRAQAVQADNVCLKPGRHDLTYTFDMLPVRPGPYRWVVSLYENEEEVDAWDWTPETIVAADPFTHAKDEWAGLLNVPTKF
jgi:hypothetical protein